jgi:choline-glycine betaine transporter
MSDKLHRSQLSRRNMIALVVVDAVLFLLANVTAKSSSSPGTFSDVTWGIFLIGTALLIVLGLVSVVQSTRSRIADR